MTNEQGKAGPLVGSIIVILILIIGSWYFVSSRPETVSDASNSSADEIMASPDPALENLSFEQSASTELEALEADFEMLKYSELDADLDQLSF